MVVQSITRGFRSFVFSTSLSSQIVVACYLLTKLRTIHIHPSTMDYQTHELRSTCSNVGWLLNSHSYLARCTWNVWNH